jgi:hypothetical protein
VRSRLLLFLGLFSALACSGCNSRSPAQSPEILAANPPVKYQDVMKPCNDLLDGGGFTKKNAVAYHQCVLKAKDENNGYTDDLDRLSDLKRLELSRQFASGRIKADEFNLQMAEYEVNLTNQRVQRRNQSIVADSARRQAEAAQESANAADRASRAEMSRAITSSFRRAVNTNCNSFGNAVNCTTY